MPVGTPREMTVARIVAIEITVDDIPTISGLVDLEIMIQKTYPANKEAIVST
jgi:hypothetical protein